MRAGGELPAIILVATLAGCAALQPPSTDPAPPDLVAYAEQLAAANTDRREAALNAAREQWREQPGPVSIARLGLAEGQWGHPGADAAAAADHIEQALNDPAADWAPSVRGFLSVRAATLRHIASLEQAQHDARGERDELAEALDEARRKLDAITNIERDLGEAP